MVRFRSVNIECDNGKFRLIFSNDSIVKIQPLGKYLSYEILNPIEVLSGIFGDPHSPMVTVKLKTNQYLKLRNPRAIQ